MLDGTGTGRASDVIDAIDWAIAHRREFNIRVINLSLGTGGSVYKDDPLWKPSSALSPPTSSWLRQPW